MTNNVYANMADEINERAMRRAARDDGLDDYIAGIHRDAAEVRAYIEAKAKTDEVNCVLGYALSMLAGFLGDKDSARINRKLFAEWRAASVPPGSSAGGGRTE
jgi:hypothetical protein